jgi:integrase
VQELADEFLAPYNNNKDASLLSAATLNHWMEKHYLPMIKDDQKASTYRDYVNKWCRYVKPNGEIPLRDFRAVDGQEMLKAIACREDLSTTTLRHIRNLVSGAFSCAIRLGVVDRENPIRNVKVPKGRGPKNTYAYSLEEVTTMLTVLPEPAATIVAVACYTGLRDSELRGLRWEDYDGEQLYVSRSVWRGKVDATKTSASEAPVPVIKLVAERLDAFRRSLGQPASGYIFITSKGTLLDLQVFAQRMIRPALAAAGMLWHGYHACRRGLATNLHRLGIPDVLIQRILRHSNVSVTQRCYIKTAAQDAVNAMKKLEQAARATVVQQPKRRRRVIQPRRSKRGLLSA